MGDTPEDLAGEVVRGLRGLEDTSAEALLPLVYDELRALAQRKLARGGGAPTLQPTALVHEAWLRVAGDEDPGWECRAHFYGAAAQAMRDILVERARKASRLRHGGSMRRIELHEETSEGAPAAVDSLDLLALDEALDRLEALSAVKARIVGLRFFAGMTRAEIARALGLSLKRIEREWRFARAWLQKELDGEGEG